MYEFEFWSQDGECKILYGYSMDDLRRRYQDIDFSRLTLVMKNYVD